MKGLSKLLGLILIIATFVTIIGLIIWQWNIKNIYSTQKQEISQIINSAVQKHSKDGLLLPDIILIETDSLNRDKLSDSLIVEIKNYMRERFLNNNKLVLEDLDLKPFYILPDEPNDEGNFLLTQLQLQELKSHIDFLTKQVSLEVSNTKAEVGKDIDRLNTWMSIWIAVIGFLGIFVPILVNLDVIKSADKANKHAEEARKNALDAKSESADAKEKSNTAKEVANTAIKKIDAAQEKIHKVENIETKINTLEPRVENAVSGVERALSLIEETKKGLELVHSINRLNQIEPAILIRLKGKTEKIDFIKQVLSGLLTALKESEENFNNRFTKDLLLQLIDKLRKISFFKFINASHTKEFNEMALRTEKALDNFDKSAYEDIIIALEKLILKLSIEVSVP